MKLWNSAVVALRKKPTALLIFVASLVAGDAFCQQELYDKLDAKKVKDKIFITFAVPGDTSANYSIDNPGNPQAIENGMRFSQKDDVVLYVKWMNPLVYQIRYADSVYKDPGAVTVEEFFDVLAGGFGAPLTQAAATPADKARREKAKAAVVAAAPAQIVVEFNNLNLAGWLLFVNLKISATSDVKGSSLMPLIKKLKTLDSLVAVDYAAEAMAIFDDLKNITDPSDISGQKNRFKTASDNLNKLKNHVALVSSTEKAVSAELQKTDFEKASDLKVYTQQILLQFIAQEKKIMEERERTNKYLMTQKELLERSVTMQPQLMVDNVLYLKLKQVNAARNTIKKQFISLKIFSYAVGSYERKERVARKVNFLMEKYQVFAAVVSAGFFYAPAMDTHGFGTGTNSSGETIVVEANGKPGPITALMYNLVLNTGMSQVLPFLQIGVDPTKERPFIMLGGGFNFPGTKWLSISGGGVWTWKQSLDGLELNQVVSGTADIKEHIRYEFVPQPKAYIGFQFKF